MDMSEESLYERLGGIYYIAAVVEHFAKALAEDPVTGKNSSNPFLKDWYANRQWREPGFIVLTTLWISEKADGRSEEHTSELQSRGQLVCRLLLEKINESKCTRGVICPR